jgi:hypothetical protein
MRSTWLPLLLIVALGAVLRIAKLPDVSIAYDGLQSVTHAARGFPVNVLSAILHDPHPPLYYVLLGSWMHLGTSDATILLLSVLLSLLLVTSVYWIARSAWGERVALLAALVCAIHPLAIYWSHHARMYALVMLLAVWVFHFNARLLQGGRERPQDALWVVGSELALLYCHAASAFFLFFIYVYALLSKRGDTAALRRWTAVHAVVAVGALPYLFFPLTTGQGHMQRPDLPELANALSLFVNGMEQPTPWVATAGTAVYLLVTGLLLSRRKQRAFALAFLVLPFAVAAGVSHALRPVWYAPRLFAFLVPFVAIGVARLAVEPGPRWWRGLATSAVVLAVALMGRGAGGYTFHFEKEQRFVDAVRIIDHARLPGDLVVVPGLKDKWAFNWYFAGPEWSRGVWQAGSWETAGRFLKRGPRRSLLQTIGGYGRDASGPVDGLGVLPLSVGEVQAGDVAKSAPRIWILARSPEQAEALRARLDLARDGTEFEVAGLELTVYER